jgi:hypothetical protein
VHQQFWLKIAPLKVEMSLTVNTMPGYEIHGMLSRNGSPHRVVGWLARTQAAH